MRNKSLCHRAVLFFACMLFVTSTAILSKSAMPQTLETKDVPQIVKMALEAQDKEVVLQNMRKLVVIGDKKAATAFIEVFKSKVPALKLPVRQFIVLASTFEYGQDKKEEVGSLLRELFDTYNHALTTAPTGVEFIYQYRSDMVKIAGILTTFGDERFLKYLVDEYRKSKSSKWTVEEENIQGEIFEELCQSNQLEASQFIINELPNSVMLPSTAVGTMLMASNPYALDIARKYIRVESDAFDLIEAKMYLKAIITFGGTSIDRTFLDRLNTSSKKLFGVETTEELRPLIIQAYENTKNHHEE